MIHGARCLSGLLLSLVLAAAGRAQPVPVVAAENFYGDIAHQVGGDDAAVASVLSDPDQDPHLFEASPSVGRLVAGARVAIVNGAGYDPWMDTLLAASPAPGRAVIHVAGLLGRKDGDNPHLWYDPAAASVVAKAVAAALGAVDPAHAHAFGERLGVFVSSLRPLDAKIAEMRRRYAGLPVAATEPVFGYMATALGLAMLEPRFQLAVMNDAEPRASDVAAFESDLRSHRVRLLIYNSQATSDAAQRIRAIAEEARVPVVGVTETEPGGTTFQGWMLGELDAVDRALAGEPR